MKSLQRSAIKETDTTTEEVKLKAEQDAVIEENISLKSLKSRSESALSTCRDEPDSTLGKIELIQAHLLVKSLFIL